MQQSPRLHVSIQLAVICCAVALGFPTLSYAASFERVLVPVVIAGEIPGAFASRWTTELAVTNAGAEPIMIRGYVPYPHGCVILCSEIVPTPPGITFFPIVNPGPTTQGAVILVDQDHANDVRFNLRVKDLSRQDQTWGTEIPVVRETRMFTVAFDLLDVPVTAGFRSMLRLYGIDARQPADVLVRFWKTETRLRSPIDVIIDPEVGFPKPDMLLAERIVSLRVESRSSSTSEFDLGYAEISNIGEIEQLRGNDRVRVEIVPITPGLRLWGFVSTTNNATQHVTAVTPQ